MKRILSLIIIGIICQLQVIAQSSYRVAEQFFKTEKETREKNKETSLKKVMTDMGNVEVYNRQEGGFVVMVGNEDQWQIIGYSDKGSFDFEDNNASVIRTIFNKDTISTQVRHVFKSGSPIKGPYLTTQWHRREPYNAFCPYDTIAQQRMGVGSTTVAMAQLLNYYRSPSHSTYHRFDWDNMLDSYEDGNYTEQEATAVATLFSDLAQEATHINFRVDGSTGVIPISYNGFTSIYVEPNNWLDFLNQCDKPQILSIAGQSESGLIGHTVVMDGIDSNGFWHINWGWGGYCDGWYQPNYFILPYGNENVRMYLYGRDGEDQTFLNPDPNYYRPGMKLNGGVSVEPQTPRAGDKVTVTLHNVQYTNTNYCNFSFQKDYGTSFGLTLYYPFPWNTTGTVWGIGVGGDYTRMKYNPSYVGQKYIIQGSESPTFVSTDMKYQYNFSNADIKLTFTMPNLPDNQDMILRPEYYLYWHFSHYPMRFWPEREEPQMLGVKNEWLPFPSYINRNSTSSEIKAESQASQVSNGFIIHKNNDGTYSVTPTTLGDLKYSDSLTSDMENMVMENPFTNKRIIGYYSIDGIYSTTEHKGFNIIKYSDGSISKVIR